ncbi:MAG: metallophosphoesterase, partial [Planctomycetes bacterium]|nr:metallophosphoesterase [Planctomycetota bacterium]
SDQVSQVFYEDRNNPKFKEVNLILSCGDLQPEYLTYLTSTFDAPLFFIRGNHDLRYDTKPPEGCIDVHARIQQFQGMNILGLDGSHWYNGGPNQYKEYQMRKIIRQLRLAIWWRRGLDIIITHAPPRHIHDAEDQCHRGFQVFNKLIDKYHPSYFVHGHIHGHFADPSERITVVNRTTVINTFG